jgi:hypothetical protein
VQGAKEAIKAKAQKERQALLNPPPTKKRWKKEEGSGGSDRWRPSADFVEQRRGRGKRG